METGFCASKMVTRLQVILGIVLVVFFAMVLAADNEGESDAPTAEPEVAATTSNGTDTNAGPRAVYSSVCVFVISAVAGLLV